MIHFAQIANDFVGLRIKVFRRLKENKVIRIFEYLTFHRSKDQKFSKDSSITFRTHAMSTGPI